ncbi:YdcF family protein [Fuchsiella alkaliacetigena]|uniref:YdcF family protein n=1 Tax=Fuchsiella alkaliacetigena TaxID=957042 RepID=UPI00200B70D5|nr:YdcF family protein [Fuchsiella alkaliacetigena]
MRMLFDLIAQLLLPPGSFLVLIVAIFIVFVKQKQRSYRRHDKRIARYLVVILLILAYLLSTYPGEWLFTNPLESSFAPLETKELNLGPESSIVILGGGMRSGTKSGFEVGDRTLKRLQAGWELHQQTGADLVLSGGPFNEEAAISEAEVMEELLLTWGAEPEQIITEVESQNTWENAVNTSSLLAETDYEQLVLVTSAVHMRRATYSFAEHWEEELLSVPVDYRLSSESKLRRFIPNLESLDNSLSSVHEWVGGLWYFFKAL